MADLAPALRAMLRDASRSDLLRIRRITHQLDRGDMIWMGDVLWLRVLRQRYMEEPPDWMAEE